MAKSTSLVQGTIVHAAIDENVLSDALKTTCENRKWVFNVHEMVNPKTGNRESGFLATLDMNSRIKIDD